MKIFLPVLVANFKITRQNSQNQCNYKISKISVQLKWYIFHWIHKLTWNYCLLRCQNSRSVFEKLTILYTQVKSWIILWSGLHEQCKCKSKHMHKRTLFYLKATTEMMTGFMFWVLALGLHCICIEHSSTWVMQMHERKQVEICFSTKLGCRMPNQLFVHFSLCLLVH